MNGALRKSVAVSLVDTEVLLGKAANQDYMICADPTDAEVVVVNTCGFIDQARDESLSAIREAVRWKKSGQVKSVIVAGCMAQRYGDEIRKAVPDKVFGKYPTAPRSIAPTLAAAV